MLCYTTLSVDSSIIRSSAGLRVESLGFRVVHAQSMKALVLGSPPLGYAFHYVLGFRVWVCLPSGRRKQLETYFTLNSGFVPFILL